MASDPGTNTSPCWGVLISILSTVVDVVVVVVVVVIVAAVSGDGGVVVVVVDGVDCINLRGVSYCGGARKTVEAIHVGEYSGTSWLSRNTKNPRLIMTVIRTIRRPLIMLWILHWNGSNRIIFQNAT